MATAMPMVRTAAFPCPPMISPLPFLCRADSAGPWQPDQWTACHSRVPATSGVGGDEMRHLGRARQREPVHRVLHQAIRIGDAFVLAKMLHPGFDKEGFEHTAFVGCVLEHTPAIGAI